MWGDSLGRNVHVLRKCVAAPLPSEAESRERPGEVVGRSHSDDVKLVLEEVFAGEAPNVLTESTCLAKSHGSRLPPAIRLLTKDAAIALLEDT